MRLEKRLQTSRVALVLAPVGAVLFTLLVSSLLVLWAGAPVGQTYALLLQGGFGSVFALSETFTRAIPLMLTGLAGLAGAIEVAGRTSYLTLDMSPGSGYSGIVIAMLAALHPLAVTLASVFVAGVLVGADSMSRALGVPSYIADVIVAASLISVLLASSLTQYRIRWK